MSATATKSAKKAAHPKKPADHPKYKDMITAAITALKDKKGSSRQAIVKYIKSNYKVGDNVNIHVRMALKRMVQAKSLTQKKGSGASGSFSVGEAAKKQKVKKAKKPKKVAVTPKKPKAKKPKAAGAKKSAKPKAPKAKKPKSSKKSAAKPAKKSPAKKPVKSKAKKTPKKAAKK